jgi:hypothetical protein
MIFVNYDYTRPDELKSYLFKREFVQLVAFEFVPFHACCFCVPFHACCFMRAVSCVLFHACCFTRAVSCVWTWKMKSCKLIRDLFRFVTLLTFLILNWWPRLNFKNNTQLLPPLAFCVRCHVSRKIAVEIVEKYVTNKSDKITNWKYSSLPFSKPSNRTM